MGTHPIFESDFDCLTECPSTTVSGIKLKFRMTKMTHILTSTLHHFSSGGMKLESNEWTKWQKKKSMTDAELEKQVEEWKIKEREFEKKEKSQPLNVDTIGTVASSASRINKAKTEVEIKSEEETMKDYSRFTKKWEAEIKKFGMLKKLEDSQKYL